MLIRFYVRNFRSFKNETNLVAIANKDIVNSKWHVRESETLDLLRGMFVFGKNGSGKSNLTTALKFMKDLALGSKISEVFKNEAKNNGVTVFQVDLLLDSAIYSYNMAINTDTFEVAGESLVSVGKDGQDKTVLLDRGEGELTVNACDSIETGKFLLSTIADLNPMFGAVVAWFKNIAIIPYENVATESPSVLNRLSGFDIRPPFSDGGKRLLGILSLLDKAKNGGLLVIDDIDKCLHPNVTLELIRLFFEDSKEKNLQFIATTHCDGILEDDSIRNDEILIIRNGIVALDRFVDIPRDRRNAYLIGRFAGVPIITI